MITLEKHPEARARNIRRCKDKGILLPTFAQMKAPEKAPPRIKEALKKTGLWDLNPLNLFRISWRNQPVESGGLFGEVNFLEFPPLSPGFPRG